jgi:hypothetical protein
MISSWNKEYSVNYKYISRNKYFTYKDSSVDGIIRIKLEEGIREYEFKD